MDPVGGQFKTQVTGRYMSIRQLLAMDWMQVVKEKRKFNVVTTGKEKVKRGQHFQERHERRL